MELYSYIRNLCDKGENTEVEFKSALGGFPGSFWETYSAFGNTAGGIIVLGIKEKNHKFTPDHLTTEQVAKYKKQYWDDVHNKSKVSSPQGGVSVVPASPSTTTSSSSVKSSIPSTNSYNQCTPSVLNSHHPRCSDSTPTSPPSRPANLTVMVNTSLHPSVASVYPPSG